MFDSNALDAILDHGDAPRIRAAALTVMITRIQEGELRRIPDAARRQRLLDLLVALRAQRVEPAALAWDAAPDAVIAATAAQHCDLLVSDDRDIARGDGLRVLTYADFRTEFLA